MQTCVHLYLCILANVPIWIHINTNICIHVQTQETEEMHTIVSTGYKKAKLISKPKAF